MKKRIVLIALAIVLVLGCGIGAWLYFGTADEPADNGWIPAQAYLRRGALSESGYYYEQDVLTYFDFATGGSVALCSKAVCDHDDETCDGYLGGHHFMAFQNDSLYYLDTDYYGLHLYRRSAIGADLVKLCDIGTKFVEEQYAVEIKESAQAGHYLYYAANVVGTVNKDGYSTTESVRCYIGRIHLATGREEILIERDAEAALLRLIAVRNGSVLFRTEGRVDVDYHDPAYKEKNSNAPVTLERWDEETGETTELFRKKRTECLSIYAVCGDKVYYAAKPDAAAEGRGETRVFSLSTGEDELDAENATYRYLGSGYAMRRIGEEDWHLYDLTTGKVLPYALEEVAHSYCVGKSGVVIRYSIKRGDYSGTECSYVPYTAMADGLQESDLHPVFVQMNTEPDKPTTPTEPTDPADKENGYPPISFDNFPPVSNEELDPQIQYLPQTVDNPQNLPVLKWVFFYPYRNPLTEDAFCELNQLLADRDMPFRIQFVVFRSEASATTAEMKWFSREIVQEALKDADLIYGYMYPDERQEYLMPITDYVTGNAQPGLTEAVLHSSLWVTEEDGNIYGIPSVGGYAKGGGWHVDAEVFEKFGLTEKDFQKNFWEMDEVFAKLHQANGNKPFLYLNYESSFSYPAIDDNGNGPDIALPADFEWETRSLYQYIGAYYGIDCSTGTPTVVNVLEADAYRSMQSAVMRYLKAGYVTRGQYSLAQSLLYFSDCYADEPYYLASNDIVVVPTTPLIQQTSYVGVGFSGVAAASEHKEEALMLLKLIIGDEAFRNQLLYGKEGRDYKIENGLYDPIWGDDGEFYSLQFLFDLGDPVKAENTKLFFPVREGQTVPEARRENADRAVWRYFPITFDFSGFEAELEEIGKIIGKYYCFFANTTDRQISSPEFGTLELPEMTEELYDQMLQELNDAGSDAILAELQRQLDAWIVDNPNWNK